MEFFILLIFCVIPFIIFINVFIADEFYKIARDKGYTDKKYFWICFWLGFIGYVMVAAMPQKNKEIPIQNTPIDETKEVPTLQNVQSSNEDSTNQNTQQEKKASLGLNKVEIVAVGSCVVIILIAVICALI